MVEYISASYLMYMFYLILFQLMSHCKLETTISISFCFLYAYTYKVYILKRSHN